MSDPCDRCNGTEVLMKADLSGLVPCPECTARTTKNGDNK